jgi:hypothetical protein
MNNLKLFTLNFLKVASVRMRFSPGFLSGQDFPWSKMLQRGSRTPEELLSGAPFPQL